VTRSALATRDGPNLARLLALWERGIGHCGWARADAILHAANGEPVSGTLGQCALALLELHTRLFGTDLALLSHCPACGAVAEFGSTCERLASEMAAPAGGVPSHYSVEADGFTLEFRLPDTTDVVAASSEPTDESFARHVLARCVHGCTRDGATVPLSAVSEAALDAVSRRMDALDPAASMSFALECPNCATRWNASLDVGRLVWDKVRASAEQVLLDIDLLARTYGWTEREVLGLTPVRRAAYVQLASA
jgi:hypothetical protein